VVSANVNGVDVVPDEDEDLVVEVVTLFLITKMVPVTQNISISRSCCILMAGAYGMGYGMGWSRIG